MEHGLRAERDRARERLLRWGRRVRDLIDTLGEGLSEPRTWSTGDLSAYDNHPADAGAETFERGKDLGLLDSYRRIERKIDEALERLEAGTYGTCVRCGRPIEAERLEILPWAARCSCCQAEVEGQNPEEESFDRPVEELVLSPPFARTFTDGEQKPRYDGEDAWQDVARYGTANSPQDVPDSVDYQDTYINADEPRGVVQPVEGIPDVAEKGATDFEAIYPDPVEDRERRPHPLGLRTEVGRRRRHGKEGQ